MDGRLMVRRYVSSFPALDVVTIVTDVSSSPMCHHHSSNRSNPDISHETGSPFCLERSPTVALGRRPHGAAFRSAEFPHCGRWHQTGNSRGARQARRKHMAAKLLSNNAFSARISACKPSLSTRFAAKARSMRSKAHRWERTM